MNICTRRTLLQSAAVGLAAAGLGPFVSGAEAGEKKRKFTMDLVCGNIGAKADQRNAIRLAQQFGFESIGAEAEFLARLSDAGLQDLLGEMKQKKVAWGAAGLPVDFRGAEAKFIDDLNRLPVAAKGLERAGVGRVSTWLSPSHGSLPYVANFRQHARRLREVAKVLGEHGLRLGLEYVGPKTSWAAGRFPFIHTMAEMKELIADIGQRNVGFLLDSWHWYNARESQADLLSLRGADVVACDLNDAPAGIPVDQQRDGSRELPCATGVIDLKAFLGALVQIGYDGPIRAEPFNKPLREMPPDKALAATADAMRKAFALVD